MHATISSLILSLLLPRCSPMLLKRRASEKGGCVAPSGRSSTVYEEGFRLPVPRDARQKPKVEAGMIGVP